MNEKCEDSSGALANLTNSVRIIIADDHEIVCAALTMLLRGSERFLVVGQADGPTKLSAILSECQCDLLLVDLHMPEPAVGDGISMLAHLRIDHPNIKIVVFTASSSPSQVEASLLCGADGYLNKVCARAELIEALDVVSAGQRYICAASQHALLRRAASPNSPLEGLTRCEVEVLRLLRFGLSVGTIARLRARAIGTVSHQKRSAMQRLGVRRDGELFAQLAKLDPEL